MKFRPRTFPQAVVCDGFECLMCVFIIWGASMPEFWANYGKWIAVIWLGYTGPFFIMGTLYILIKGIFTLVSPLANEKERH